MTYSPIGGLSYHVPGEIGSETTVNANYNRLETMAWLLIKDRDLTAPPGSPANGDAYLVAATATGAWTGQEGKIAVYYDGWVFVALKGGAIAYVQDEGEWLGYTGAAWVTFRAIHGLVVSDILAGAAEVEAVALSQVHGLTASDIMAGAAELDAPAVAEA